MTAADKLRELLATMPPVPNTEQLVRWWRTSKKLLPEIIGPICEEGRFGLVACVARATTRCEGFAAQTVRLCDKHAAELLDFEGWNLYPIEVGNG